MSHVYDGTDILPYIVLRIELHDPDWLPICFRINYMKSTTNILSYLVECNIQIFHVIFLSTTFGDTPCYSGLHARCIQTFSSILCSYVGDEVP
jgi:hypothetical protein